MWSPPASTTDDDAHHRKYRSVSLWPDDATSHKDQATAVAVAVAAGEFTASLCNCKSN